ADTGIPVSAAVRASVAVDTQGRVWVAEEKQIGQIDDGSFSQVIEAPQTNFITRARGGGLWVCSDSTLYKYDDKTGLSEVAKLPVPHAAIATLRLFEDRRGTLWIGTAAAGLFHFDGSRFEHVATPQARTTCLAEDHEGNLWAGSDAGLNRVSPRAIEVEGTEAGLPLGS